MAESIPQILPEKFPIGQRVSPPGHFLERVTLEGIRFIGSGYECRVRLADGTPDEAIFSLEEGAALSGRRRRKSSVPRGKFVWRLKLRGKASTCSSAV